MDLQHLARTWSTGWRLGVDGHAFGPHESPQLNTREEFEAWEDGLITGHRYRTDPGSDNAVSTNPYKPANTYRLDEHGNMIPTLDSDRQ